MTGGFFVIRARLVYRWVYDLDLDFGFKLGLGFEFEFDVRKKNDEIRENNIIKL